MYKKIIATILVFLLLAIVFSGCLESDEKINKKPTVNISYPSSGSTVSGIAMITGTASDPNGDDDLSAIEVMINDDGRWQEAMGTAKWSFHWNTYDVDDGFYHIKVRSWDSLEYSEIDEITLRVDNPESVESGSHKWALFVAVANSAADDDSKLGNGGLYLAEEMAAYLIEKCGYSTSNIIILFDDGWIRSNNGFGVPIKTLQQRKHDYDVVYSAATRRNLESAIKHIIDDSNKYDDSEVFIWVFGHGQGETENTLTGGKLLQRSKIVLWDSALADNELGHLLSNLRSKETCILVDACFSGGFADKTIFNFPTFFLLKSEVPKIGRVAISGASKYRTGYASTTHGPLFTLLWFEGIKTGKADGFKPGLLNMGRPTTLKLYKDGKVSVEEAFYYAKYTLRKDEHLEDYSKMEPQINDRYPLLILNNKGLILG